MRAVHLNVEILVIKIDNCIHEYLPALQSGERAVLRHHRSGVKAAADRGDDLSMRALHEVSSFRSILAQ